MTREKRSREGEDFYGIRLKDDVRFRSLSDAKQQQLMTMLRERCESLPRLEGRRVAEQVKEDFLEGVGIVSDDDRPVDIHEQQIRECDADFGVNLSGDRRFRALSRLEQKELPPATVRDDALQPPCLCRDDINSQWGDDVLCHRLCWQQSCAHPIQRHGRDDDLGLCLRHGCHDACQRTTHLLQR